MTTLTLRGRYRGDHKAEGQAALTLQRPLGAVDQGEVTVQVPRDTEASLPGAEQADLEPVKQAAHAKGHEAAKGHDPVKGHEAAKGHKPATRDAPAGSWTLTVPFASIAGNGMIASPERADGATARRGGVAPARGGSRPPSGPGRSCSWRSRVSPWPRARTTGRDRVVSCESSETPARLRPAGWQIRRRCRQTDRDETPSRCAEKTGHRRETKRAVSPIPAKCLHGAGTGKPRSGSAPAICRSRRKVPNPAAPTRQS